MAITNPDTAQKKVDISTAAKALIATGQESYQWATKLRGLIVAAQGAHDGMGTHKLYLVRFKNDIYLSTSAGRDGLYLGQVDIVTQGGYVDPTHPTIGVEYLPCSEKRIVVGGVRIPLAKDGTPKIPITRVKVRGIVDHLLYIIDKMNGVQTMTSRDEGQRRLLTSLYW